MECFLNVWLPILTTIIQALALIFLVWYTFLTRSISRHAQEQAEAMQKPVLALAIALREDEQDQVMERITQKNVPQAVQLAMTGNLNFILRNMGTGPALNVSFDFVSVDPNPDAEGGAAGRYARRVPYIRPAGELETSVSYEDMMYGDKKFTARYESLSGTAYITEMVLHLRAKRTVVLREDWIFERVQRPWWRFWS
jgi:hypothetical protein